MDVEESGEVLMKPVLSVSLLVTSLLLASAVGSSAACVQAAERKIIFWTDYSRGASADYEAEFGHLRFAINKEIARLPRALSEAGLISGEIIDLESLPTGSDKPIQDTYGSSAARRIWWENAKSMLGMLHGSIHSSPPMKVFSSIYSEGLDLPSLANDPGVKGQSDSQALIDSHRLIMAYALAMDAQARKCSTATVYKILEGAGEIARQLKDDGQLTGDLKVVSEAIDKKLKDLVLP
ncbi:hypothetical protein O3S81_25235 [Agrobacterium sp. SOY23]|uniref:hypothetical protein n=1 Tax=Agrobacterium sp. SOY23 TaxID=3014555 RepID=UPI0022AFA540|nr:hypothetical protein [Agrobacterium sp. SOY23]MCZ4433015.1 hypothetical protein [Agrobacterium sp. SOY23]